MPNRPVVIPGAGHDLDFPIKTPLLGACPGISIQSHPCTIICTDCLDSATILVRPHTSGLMQHGGDRICMLVVRTTALGRPAVQLGDDHPARCPARRRPGVLPAGSRNAIDHSSLYQYYAQELRGQPPLDVTMMVTLLSTPTPWDLLQQKGGAPLRPHLAFRDVVDDDPPDFRTISDLCNIHLAAFRPLFLEVLHWLARWVWSSLKPVHRRDEHRSTPLTAQGDELPLHEQRNPAATS